MDISQVIDIAVAGAGVDDVEIAGFEPAEVETSAVGSLSQIVSELVQNAAAFSKPGQSVRVAGSFDGSDYVLSISDDGIGIPTAMLDALNTVLESPGGTGEGPNLGISLVARLAARSGVKVRLDDRSPGTTASVTLPSSSITDSDRSPDRVTDVLPRPSRRVEPLTTIDLTRYESSSRPSGGHVFSVPESPADDVEAFLEKIFGPLRSKSQHRDRPAPRPSSNGSATRPPLEREPQASTSRLQVRVPGENFDVADDEPGVMSSEAAVDTRSALDKYQAGRREADTA